MSAGTIRFVVKYHVTPKLGPCAEVVVPLRNISGPALLEARRAVEAIYPGAITVHGDEPVLVRDGSAADAVSLIGLPSTMPAPNLPPPMSDPRKPVKLPVVYPVKDE